MDQIQSKIKTLAIKDENKRDKEGFVIPSASISSAKKTTSSAEKLAKQTQQQQVADKRWRYKAHINKVLMTLTLDGPSERANLDGI